jgi:hypothetical protein
LPELPNIVTRRLAERELRPGASHPDADLLNAFVEQALSERDRGAVLGHLADCASCREIVALAQPVVAETGTVVFPQPAHSGLFFLRWGALAVCAVLAVSVAVLYKRGPHEARLLAKNQISEPMSERKREPPPSEKGVLGDATEGDANKDTDRTVPAALGARPQAAEAQRKRKSEIPAVIARQFGAEPLLGADAKAKSSSPAASPMNGHAGIPGHDAIVTDTIIPSKVLELPLNGRNFTQLMQLKPGSVAGGAGGGVGSGMGAHPPVSASAPDAAKADASEVAQDVGQDKVVKKDEGGNLLRKSVASRTQVAEVHSEGRSKAAAVLVGGAVAAPPPAPVAGEVRGLVVDPSGAAVSGAKITVTNTATGASLASSTNEAGSYDVPSVPPGPYTIAISKPGFQEFVRSGLKVEPVTVALNATLQIGAMAETVTVEAQGPVVDTTSTSVSSVTAYGANTRDAYRASSAEIANLPNLVAARPAGTWQITAAGNLQRSFDGGKSWESVPVVQPTTNQPGVNQTGRLRVVAAAGFHVWVGCDGGVLLHSQDTGGHFTNVKVHRKKATLTGDIVALAFSDTLHGRLETADHDVWTTSDGGKTWRPSASAK